MTIQLKELYDTAAIQKLDTVLRLWRAELGRPGRRASVHQVAAAGATIGERVRVMLRLLK